MVWTSREFLNEAMDGQVFMEYDEGGFGKVG